MMKKNDFTFGEWLWQWYRLYKRDDISSDWQKQYERAFILHVPKDLFNKRLIEVSALDIDLALYDMGRTRTATFMYNVYTASLKRAYQIHLITEDISVNVNRIRSRTVRSKPLTDFEIDHLFKELEHSNVKYFYAFQLLTGCRRSEALALKFNDIDYDLRLIHIRGTKTANSDRYIPMTDELYCLIMHIPINMNNRLFPYTANYVSKKFKTLLPNHKLHDLRHTFATRCATCGLHPAITQSILGHATPDFTLKVYTHIDSRNYLSDLSNVHKKLPVKITGDK